MSGHTYTNRNLFDEDDIDDETFLKNSRRYTAGSDAGDFEKQQQSFLERKREIEERTLSSSERSIGLLRDSEQVGIATAEELLRQREQLERTDKRLDEINQTLRFSQKHINGIKSVFSSLKNYISSRSDTSSPSLSSSSSGIKPPTATITETVDEYDRYDNHPVTRLKELEATTGQSRSKDFSARLDANLQEMHSSISKLKGLATDMSSEIDSQNELIGNITDKTELADITIKRQNKDINRLLKK